MMICALPVQPLLTLLQFSWMTKTVLLLCFNMPNNKKNKKTCQTVGFGTHSVQDESAQSDLAWPYPVYLTDLTVLLESTLVSSSPPSLLHK
jgi:hypothetical protein